eukprot:gnl/MRDRNA2_/MRDRNA2_75998_c0_seq2.p1 gnl/MRDRNA2_/MRDRNA2_75998_c0~~gnl/MRDRNA2_/MRDRNA2_75998_c0_seq2.p1  ORF type:complete len:677 (+),score=177.83 gnl/MRDRNA2_/MRDRNA2_75998_c0_seq2:273-2033(+)
MSEAEAAFVKAEDAQEAISVLDGADLRGEEDKDQVGYTGLKLKPKHSQPNARATMSNGTGKSPAMAPVINGGNRWNQEDEDILRLKPKDTALSKPKFVSRQPPAATEAQSSNKSTESRKAVAPLKSAVGTIKRSTLPPSKSKPAAVSTSRYAGFSQFVGTWSVRFEFEEPEEPGRWRSWDINYKIGHNGEMRVGKKGTPQLVPAGSPDDWVADANYEGKYFIKDLPKRGEWEYVWIEDGVMQVHHFSEEDVGESPLGSPNFCLAGEGTCKERNRSEAVDEDGVDASSSNKRAKIEIEEEEVYEDPADQDLPLQVPVHVPDLEGVWYRKFETEQGEHDGGKFTIYDNGEVKMGKKRRLQLVHAGSVDDVRQDPNYQFDGCFLLNKAMGKGTWEYVWLENGIIEMHHFGNSEIGESPLGSPNFWGAGTAFTEKASMRKEQNFEKAGSVSSFRRPLSESAYAMSSQPRSFARPLSESAYGRGREPTLRELLSGGKGSGKGGGTKGGKGGGKWLDDPIDDDDPWGEDSFGPDDRWGKKQQDSWDDDSWGQRRQQGSWERRQRGSWEDDEDKDSWGSWGSWDPPSKKQRMF